MGHFPPPAGADASRPDLDDADPVGSDSRHNPLPAVTLDDDVFSGQPASVSVQAASYVPAQVGRFPILRRLGAGGMGAVYAAYDELLDRKVALKVMHSTRAGSLGRRQRTLVEARALARLTQANIPMVYEVGEAEGQVYISMEYIDGATLADWLAEAPRSWQDILAMYLQAGAGLAAAHQAGIVHRVRSDRQNPSRNRDLMRAEKWPGKQREIRDLRLVLNGSEQSRAFIRAHCA